MTNTSGEHRPRRLLKYSAILLVAAQLAYAAFLAMESWNDVRAEQAGLLATVAELDAGAVDTYFSQLDIGMRNLGAELTDSRSSHDLGRAYNLVHRFQKLHTELGNVILMRGDGQLLLTGNEPNNPDMPTLAGDPVFMKFRGELQQSARLVIGRPVAGNIDKRWVVAARYAVTDRTGKLVYIISANLPANFLQTYWVDTAIPKISALGLVRDDGYLVSRYPEPGAARQDILYGQPAEDAMTAYLRAKKYPQQGLIEMPDGNGRTADLRALQRLKHFPATLFVDMPMSEVRAAWLARLHDTYFLLALMMIGIVVFYGMSFRRRRAWSTEQRREVLRHKYEQALNERSPNEILLFDAETLQISFANDYALKHTGYTLAEIRQKDILSLHPEMGIEVFGALIEPLRRGEQDSVSYQTIQARSDGSSYPVEISLQLMKPDQGGAGFMAIINDITALKLAEENFRKFNAPVERRTARRK
ncbi:MAG: PAS domain S-box protein [Gallionella sp.]|nr:PAS domain S-box protein [Gallionella sp.]